MEHIITYFKDKQVEDIGIGTFGPINIDPTSSQYGNVTTTPKSGWAYYPFLGTLKKVFDIPYGWDMDVNAAAFGETIWGGG